jgi:hypothetical protein
MDGRQIDVVLNDAETGIWGIGTGWELGLYSLDSFLRGELPDAPAIETFDGESPEIQDLANRLGEAWAATVEPRTRQAPPAPHPPHRRPEQSTGRRIARYPASRRDALPALP